MKLDQLKYAAEKYGTPLYVFDLDETKRVMNSVREETAGTADICYAMKANPFIAGRMARISDRIEVCSMGEYEICRALGIGPEKLLISGVLKEERDMDRILEECGSLCIYTVESPGQFRYFRSRAKDRADTLRLYLRLTSGNQFGMDEETVKELIAESRACSGLRVEGLHYFPGTQKKSSVTLKELDKADRFLTELEAAGFDEIEELEFGPGLAMPYFEGQSDTRREDLSQLCQAVRNMKWKGRVCLEMGRFLAGSCGDYLTAVRDIKTGGGKNYCIVDGGIHQLNYDGQIRGMYLPHMEVIHTGDTEGPDISGTEDWTVCGALCTANDILVGKAPLDGLKTGDVLVFHRTGAYSVTEGMALFLSRDLPGVVFYSDEDGWKLIRPGLGTWTYNMERTEG